MLKAFLSHSSKQKGYVEIVAEQLGKSNIVFDKWTFEEGNRTIDEIFQGLKETEVFVLFISDEALDSPWVKSEILKAQTLFNDGNIKKLYPIIIDDSINYNDSRIPAWIQDHYNLKYVSKPTKAAERIKQLLKIISWDLYPKNRQLSQLFIGRTAHIRKYEERIFDYEKPAPIVMISTGLPSIGRKKYTHHCLSKSNKIREAHALPKIFLGSRDGIEDLILKIYDLGFSKVERESLLELLTKDMAEKISLATTLLMEAEKYASIIVIVDNFAVVARDSLIADWFQKIIQNISTIDRLFICLISRRRVKFSQLVHNNRFFAIEIPELEKYERNALLNALLDINELQINKSDFAIISELLNGFPEQVFFTVDTIVSEGLPHLIENLHIIPEYNSLKVAHVVQQYEQNEFAKQVLGFLANCEFISLALLEEIFGGDTDEIGPLVKQLSHGFIIEFVGATREYMRLNDAVRDYIQRIGIKLNEKYSEKFEAHIKSAFDDYDTIDRDVSDYVISVKESLKRRLFIPEELLLPSHFLNAMRDLYTNERRYSDVINLADRVLLEEKYLDARISREVRYWLCLSLARSRDNRMLEVVQHIDGSDHNFLLGFYYRLTGRPKEAIEKFLAALKTTPSFFRAKSELVQVYINLAEYEKAFGLAKENYGVAKNNPYNIQSYFRCLIKSNEVPYPERKSELEKLLISLKENPHEKAKEMYMTSLTDYQAYILNDKASAINTANDAIAMFPKRIYPPPC